MTSLAVAAPAACGELFQGPIEGRTIHVSCPVSVFNLAQVLLDDDRPWRVGEKTRAAIEAVFGEKPKRRFAVRVTGGAKTGIGMASSTADIAAALTVALKANGRGADQVMVAKAALGVEPTDGTIFSGIAAFDHRSGRYLRLLSRAPRLFITYVDTGGSVDTIRFNRRKLKYTTSQKRRAEKAFCLVEAGLRQGDPAILGAGATLSAELNEEVLPKPGFARLLEVAREQAAYGVVVAHSGTVMGLLHERPAGMTDALSVNGLGPAETVALIDGGCRYAGHMATAWR